MDLLQDVVHLQQFGLNEGAVGARDVANVIQAQVVEDQDVPVVPLQGAVQVPGHIVVNLRGDTVKKKKNRIKNNAGEKRRTLIDAEDSN